MKRRNIKQKTNSNMTYQFSNFKCKRRQTQKGERIQDDLKIIVAYQIIQALLSKVYSKYEQIDIFLAVNMCRLKKLEKQSQLYFQHCHQHEDEVMCCVDEEPKQLERKVIEMKKMPINLKKVNRSKLLIQTSQIPEEQRTNKNIMEIVDRNKQNMIQKLKKQYSMILQKKNSSQIQPYETHSLVIDKDDQEILQLRKNYSKNKVKPKHKLSIIEEQLRNNHKILTIFKKSKDFVEAIDPTSSTMFASQMIHSIPTNRNAKSLHRQMNDHPRVQARQSNHFQVFNFSQFETSSISQKFHISQTIENRLSDPLTNYKIQQLKYKVQKSILSANKAKMKQISITQRKVRQVNSLSVSVLPKISNR